jgi:aminomethyltransferase
VLSDSPLIAWHVANGAKMAAFAGWNMPVSYPDGINAEHMHTRSLAGLFDISHMGEILVRGKDAASGLARAVTVNMDTLKPGRCRYAFLLTPEGGILDDLIVYRLKEDRFMVVVNAACRETDYAAIRDRVGPGALAEDISAATAKLDLQGPASFSVLEAVLPGPWHRLPYFGLVEKTFEGKPLLVSRTGYTGELGVELYCPWEQAEKLWLRLLSDARVRPAGLGARDTLRLEAGLPLNGQDLDPGHTPAEAGYAAILTSQASYVGKDGALRLREKLLPLLLSDHRSPSPGDTLALPSGRPVGTITSGNFAPSCGRAIAFAYVLAEAAGETDFLIRTPKAELPAALTSLPFHKGGTARAALV